MAISKNFVVKNGLEVANTLVYGTSALDRVGIGSTIPKSKLDVQGNLRAEGDLRAAGFGTITKGFEVGIGGTMLTVEATGLTGINKATPLYSLDVVKIGSGTTAINAVGSVVATENVTIGGTVTASRGSFSSYVRIAGVTTLAADGGITTTGGNLFVGDSLDVDGHTELDQLNVSGVSTFVDRVTADDIDASTIVVSGFSTFSGVSVSEFTANGIGATSIIVSGFSTFSGASADGIGATSIIVSGFSTFSGVSADGIGATSINVTGVSTFVGLSTFNNGIIVESGISTFVDGIDANSGVNVSGSVTATTFFGDGSNLTGFPAGAIGIQSGGTVIGSATTLNFVGTGNTFLVNGNIIDISIQGGAGGGVGTAIPYPDNTTSPFSYVDHTVHATQSITFDATNAGLGSSYILVQEPELIIDPGVVLTVGAGKTIITDLFMLEGRPGWDLDPEFNSMVVTGITTLGVTTFTANVTIGSSMLFGDNDKLMFGDGDDLQLFHDGSNSLIEDVGTGGLQLRSDTDISLRRRSNGDVMLLATPASSVELNFNNNKKFETTNNGVIVSGICTATSFSGNLTGNVTGNADTATAATRVTLTDQSADTTCFPVFCQSATGDQLPHTNSSLTYNSSNGTLTATTFSGALSGNATSATSATTATTATNATNITLADESSDTTCFPVFATDATGNQAPKTDSSALTYDASTGTLAATNVNSTSDANLKENVETIVGSIDILKDINGVKFVWKELGTPSVGVIAQDVEKVLPELVSQRSDNGTKSVNYNGLVGVLIEAVKELSARVESLENQLNNQ